MSATVDAGPESLPPLLSREGYRIVQEGLSNALEHAGDRVALDVRIAVSDGRLEITVENPVTGPASSRPGGGHGLRGIADRVRLPDGTTTAGPAGERYDALRAGAARFLLKRADADALVQAVRLVARSDSLLFPAAVRTLATEHANARTRRRPVRAGGAAAHGGGAEIARRMEVGPATVKSHVAAVLAETGTRDRTQAVIAAYEAGFPERRMRKRDGWERSAPPGSSSCSG